MAKAAKKGSKKSTAIVPWKAAMEKDAELAKGMVESSAGGDFLSVQGGELSYNDNPFPNSEMAAIILDSTLEHVYYEGRYDADNIQNPTCFAFGVEENEMAPHEKVEDPQAETCNECEHNEFGTSETGKGKACGNVIRLALIPGGTLDADDSEFTPLVNPEDITSQGLAYLKVSVTSVRAFAGYVTQLAGALKRAPYGVFTKIKVVPDKKTQHKIQFEVLDEIPDDLMDAVYARHQEAEAGIDFPYAPKEEEEEKPTRAKANKKKAPARGAKKKGKKAGKY